MLSVLDHVRLGGPEHTVLKLKGNFMGIEPDSWSSLLLKKCEIKLCLFHPAATGGQVNDKISVETQFPRLQNRPSEARRDSLERCLVG